MKISKVDHTRAGISVQEKVKKKGGKSVLYYAPPQKGIVDQNIDRRITARNENAQKLYTVITPDRKFTRKRDQIKFMDMIANGFNTAIKGILVLCADKNQDTMVKKEADLLYSCTQDTILYQEETRRGTIIKRVKDCYVIEEQGMQARYQNRGGRPLYDNRRPNSSVIPSNRYDYEQLVQELVQNSTRSALRIKVNVGNENIYLPDIIEKLALYICTGDKKRYLEPLEKEAVIACLNEITRDYRKDKQLADIAKSIQNQSVGVRINNEGYLVPTYEGHRKKKYIFEFMKAYTAGTEEEKREQMVRMRQLIVLFYCGKDAYEKAVSQSTEWSFVIFEDGVKTSFSQRIERDLALYSEMKRSGDKRKTAAELREKLEYLIAGCYQDAVRVLRMEKNPDQDIYEMQNQKIDNKTLFEDSDFFWLDYIEDTAVKLITPRVNLSQGKFTQNYLCEKTWQTWTSFMAQKFIDYGKAVFHFAMPDLSDVARGEELSIGKVLSMYENGISIFDYERIKAQESLERDICEYLIFAINNFSTTAVSAEERAKEGSDDVLMRSADSSRGNYIPVQDDFTRRILQYFGGKSVWEKEKKCDDAKFVLDSSKETMFEAVRSQMYQLRNASFHYTGKTSKEIQVDDVVKHMFAFELSRIGSIYGKKYYSNNVPRYYSKQSILGLSSFLYSDKGERPAQVPSFEKVMSRKEFREYIPAYFQNSAEYRKLLSDLSEEGMKEFRSSLYYVMKEIYYYGFLQKPDLRKYFEQSLTQIKDKYNASRDFVDKARKAAVNNFERYYKTLDPDLTFGEVCQAFMIENMLQNTDDMMVHAEVPDKTSPDKESYAHFRMTLYEVIRQAFLKYLETTNQLAFLKKPTYKNKEQFRVTEEEFCDGWNIGLFKGLKDTMDADSILYHWYTVTHFLHPRQLNFLIGSIKNYIQFVGDTNRRAASLENRHYSANELAENLSYYRNIIAVLEFVQNFAGKISNDASDYFTGEDEKEQDEAYAKFLGNFVAFQDGVNTYHDSLIHFCTESVSGNRRVSEVGIYHNPEKKILNRNVIYAGLYGNPSVLAENMNKVSMSEIQEYYRLLEQLDPVFKQEKKIGEEQLNRKEDQIRLRKYQNLKNRIELYDITEYMNIINDLIGQLVSWAYLRERDMMYFRLGYYYTKLFFTNSTLKEDRLRKMDRDNIHLLDGAVLYQIAAVYTYALPVIKVHGETEALSIKDLDGMAYGGSEKLFDEKYMHDGGKTFNAGMEFVERTRESGDIRTLRNDIDHFSYFVRTNRSILDMYNDMYDIFFTYNAKIRKCVTLALINTMARYHMNIHLQMDKDTKVLSYDTDDGEGAKERNKARLVISEHGIESTEFTFKVKDRRPKFKGSREMVDTIKELALPVHENVFLDQMKRILEYHRTDF